LRLLNLYINRSALKIKASLKQINMRWKFSFRLKNNKLDYHSISSAVSPITSFIFLWLLSEGSTSLITRICRWSEIATSLLESITWPSQSAFSANVPGTGNNVALFYIRNVETNNKQGMWDIVNCDNNRLANLNTPVTTELQQEVFLSFPAQPSILI